MREKKRVNVYPCVHRCTKGRLAVYGRSMRGFEFPKGRIKNCDPSQRPSLGTRRYSLFCFSSSEKWHTCQMSRECVGLAPQERFKMAKIVITICVTNYLCPFEVGWQSALTRGDQFPFRTFKAGVRFLFTLYFEEKNEYFAWPYLLHKVYGTSLSLKREH